MSAEQERLIDRWFPVAAVDEACGTPAGSGLTEKAIFTWFASRPLAQARAAALTSLLPPTQTLKPLVDAAVRSGDRNAIEALADAVHTAFGERAPVVVDCFSGRGIFLLEAARVGAKAIGFDLSPVATLAGRLLADYPMRDWSSEPPIPFHGQVESDLSTVSSERLVRDVECILAEVGRRLALRTERLYPKNRFNRFPWGYLWATTLLCDQCHRNFPIMGALGLRQANRKANDPGQSLKLIVDGDEWKAEIVEGPPAQQPTYVSRIKEKGKAKKGKSARCIFCSHGHDLAAVKTKCLLNTQGDVLVAVADEDDSGNRTFRPPSDEERKAAITAHESPLEGSPYSAIPDEAIAPGNVHTVQASGYGYRTFGELMIRRQASQFAETNAAIREVYEELKGHVSAEYAGVLACYAASNLCRRLRRSTRGAALALSRGGVSDIFTNESKISFNFRFLRDGTGHRSRYLDICIKINRPRASKSRCGEPQKSCPFPESVVNVVAVERRVSRCRNYRSSLLSHDRVCGCVRSVLRMAEARFI